MKIYTDGGYDRVQEKGAWAYVLEDGLTYASGIIEKCDTHNIECELFAILCALENYPEADIYSDLQGALMWATKDWKASTPATKAYQDKIAGKASQIHWVKGHDVDLLNEVAHKLVVKTLSGELKPSQVKESPRVYNRLKDIVEFIALSDVHMKKPDYDILEWLADYGMDSECVAPKSAPPEVELIWELASLIKN